MVVHFHLVLKEGEYRAPVEASADRLLIRKNLLAHRLNEVVLKTILMCS